MLLNGSKNKVVAAIHEVIQGSFHQILRSSVLCMPSVSVYHSLTPTWQHLYKSMEVYLWYPFLFFNESMFEFLKSLRCRRMTTNMSIEHIPHRLYGIQVLTHRWLFHHLNFRLCKITMVMNATCASLSRMRRNSGYHHMQQAPHSVTGSVLCTLRW